MSLIFNLLQLENFDNAAFSTDLFIDLFTRIVCSTIFCCKYCCITCLCKYFLTYFSRTVDGCTVVAKQAMVKMLIIEKFIMFCCFNFFDYKTFLIESLWNFSRKNLYKEFFDGSIAPREKYSSIEFKYSSWIPWSIYDVENLHLWKSWTLSLLVSDPHAI